jgi:hypothetical protein
LKNFLTSDIPLFTKIVETNKHIKYLDTSLNTELGFTDKEILLIANAIRSNKTLIQLSINENGRDTKIFKKHRKELNRAWSANKVQGRTKEISF